jgi:HEAT repeat protein
MLALLASLLLYPTEEAENVTALLAKAGPLNPKEVRIQAIGDLEKTPVKDPKQVCRVLEQYVGEEDVEIRSAALVSLGLIASEAKTECPLAIVEAIDDADEGIRSNTQGLVHLFDKFPKAAVPLIFQAAESEMPDVREFAALVLPHVAGKTPDVKKKLKEMLDDRNEFVRHHAQIGLFKATDDFKSYVAYLLAYTSDLNAVQPTETEAQKRDQSRRVLIGFGTGIFFYESTRERPKELADVLIANLSHKEAPVRQTALRQLRAMAISSQESYQAIPKTKAQAEVAKLLEDKIEKVREWAKLAHIALEEGPPPEAPKKLEPLDKTNFRELNSEFEPKPQEEGKP